jgi:hypothetical protein
VAAIALVRTELVHRAEARDRAAELRRRATPLLAVEIAGYRRLAPEGGVEVEVNVVNNGFGTARNVRISVTWMGAVRLAALRPTERVLAAGASIRTTVRLGVDATGGLGASQIEPWEELEANVQATDELGFEHGASSTPVPS